MGSLAKYNQNLNHKKQKLIHKKIHNSFTNPPNITDLTPKDAQFL
jgi:hypothetical protein